MTNSLYRSEITLEVSVSGSDLLQILIYEYSDLQQTKAPTTTEGVVSGFVKSGLEHPTSDKTSGKSMLR